MTILMYTDTLVLGSDMTILMYTDILVLGSVDNNTNVY